MGAGMVAGVGGCKKDVRVAWHEIRAGGPAHSGADHLRVLVRHIAGGQFHGEDLIALELPGRVVRLEGDPGVIEAEISLGIVPAKSQLAQAGQVFFLRVSECIDIRVRTHFFLPAPGPRIT